MEPETMLAVCGSGSQQAQSAQSKYNPENAATQAKQNRFKLDKDHYLSALPAERLQNANFPSVLKDSTLPSRC